MPDRPRALLTAGQPTPAAPLGVVEPLLRWSETELRDLPWRRTRDPWAVLVSEVMLQQTQVARVIERYGEFLEIFPTPASCSQQPVSGVIKLWDGLGFNRRAVNLWKAAAVIARRQDQAMPTSLVDLLDLPGVGPYTARAIQAFAFEHDVGVVDTNVGRLLARWTGQRLTPSQAQSLATALVPPGQGWRWNQTLFDFAVAVCTKRQPACDGCSIASHCAWRGRGDDPATISAGVSGKQSTFEGSERQVRGRIVAALRQGAIEASELVDLGRPHDGPDDIAGFVDDLVREGLAVRVGTQVTLP